MSWTITLDCAEPRRLAAFWALALGYVEPAAPTGFASWDAWFEANEVPLDERDDGAALVDPAGREPAISFLKVPEPKTAKNRVHLDLQVSGGRHHPAEVRTPAIEATVHRLVDAGATIVRRLEIGGRLDHVWMADPEGNEFCVV